MRKFLIASLLCAASLITEGASQKTQGCSNKEWQCRNGNCISFYGKCDGVVNCADGSDEAHATCRNSPCQGNLFRCAYGACVDGTAPCNGIQECADNSDELLHRCQNETRIESGKFRCDNGIWIPITDLCDGTPDCSDDSDETLGACAEMNCDSYLFQCAYGACVDQGADCDGIQHCMDNSDEFDDLCNPTSSTTVTTRYNSGDCELPPYPDNGRYEAKDAPDARPGDHFPSANITVICNPGYAVQGEDYAICINGVGFENIPKCSRYCTLKQHASVSYKCTEHREDGYVNRACKNREFPGTKVVPKCNDNYYGSESHMTCQEDGYWDIITKCVPECGKVTPYGVPEIIYGMPTRHGEFPWHAGIYYKKKNFYDQICGGSLVTTTTVLTAAHCVYNKKVMKAEDFGVALGKIYRDWDHEGDAEYAQKSNVTEIHIPEEYSGYQNSHGGDIAVLILETEIVLQPHIRPVCVKFSELSVLKTGDMGKVTGWGLTSGNGSASEVLKVVELPFVEFKQCAQESPIEFQEFLASDKFCAGYIDGTTAVCKGDSGGGLVFLEKENRYHLRGIVSTAPHNKVNNTICNEYARTAFTDITKHEYFIKSYVKFDV